jgi:hypothetical protein
MPDPFYEIPLNEIRNVFEDYGAFGENAVDNVMGDILNYAQWSLQTS